MWLWAEHNSALTSFDLQKLHWASSSIFFFFWGSHGGNLIHLHDHWLCPLFLRINEILSMSRSNDEVTPIIICVRRTTVAFSQIIGCELIQFLRHTAIRLWLPFHQSCPLFHWFDDILSKSQWRRCLPIIIF